ncbi:MAG: hypothetical protein ACRDIY_00360 [Chloroflexota bacterium]
MPRLEIADPRPTTAWLAESARWGQPWRDPDGNPSAYTFRHAGECWIEVPGCARFRFGNGNTVFAFPERDAGVAAVRDVYLRNVLPVALQVLGIEVLHASAVHFPGGVVVFCAESEAGKSTIAYGLSRRGYPIWGDDAVAFDGARSRPRAIALPFEVRLRPAAAALFGLTPAQNGEGTFRNRSIDQARSSGEVTGLNPDPGLRTPITHARVAAVCVLDRRNHAVSGQPVQIARLTPTRAFTALLPHAYCFSLQDSEHKRRMLRQYLDLTARVAVFDVRLRTGLDNLTAILDEIVELVAGLTCPA